MNQKKFRIAILGLGSVGSKVAEILYLQKEKIRQLSGYDVELVYGYVRSAKQIEKQKLAEKFQFKLTESIDEILEDETIDVVIELLGRIEPAKSFIEQSIQSRKSVITANKDIIAQFGYELNQLAIDFGVWLVYEASVAGGIPIVDTLETHFSFDEVNEITGILNGTTNYILTQMLQERLSYQEALSNAQNLGFAESDPTNDVEGIDAAYKVMVLAQLAFQTYMNLQDVKIKGMTEITFDQLSSAEKFGNKIKLLGQLQRKEQGVYFRVEPFFVKKQHLLANIDNEINALSIRSERIGHTFISGPGAGPAPTATSILADVFRLIITKENIKAQVRNLVKGKTKFAEIYKKSSVLLDEKDLVNSYGVLLSTQEQEAIQLAINPMIADVKKIKEANRTLVWLETNEINGLDAIELENQLKKNFELIQFLPIFG